MTTPHFPTFARTVAKSFQDMAKTPQVFVVDIEADALYAAYLSSFPEGTNPLFKKNTEHDCSCCKHFIRRIGLAVTIGENEELQTIWDRAATCAPSPYMVVATTMRDLVRSGPVGDLFRVGDRELSFGAATSRSYDKESGKALTWDHFHTGEIPRHLRSALPDTARGEYRTTVQVFERGLKELTPEAVEAVLSLIENNSLYRGTEHLPAVMGFLKAQREYLKRDGKARHLYAWANASDPSAKFRNTVIGKLVQDLSEGQDLEHAVRSFESMVAPQNYKRPTALITPGMVKKAMETIDKLGLEPAMERRFAKISDVSVRDVKWVDSNVRSLMKGGLGDTLMKHAVSQRPTDADEKRAEDINIDDFVARILPETTSLELYFKSGIVGSLMSLTAPCHPEPKQLFRWNNDFAWSYAGNVADSIKERVKKAGGKVEGAVLRVSLSWFNTDDLDLHIHEPMGRGVRSLENHIYFGHRVGWTGGELDVDMNVHQVVRDAVENIVWMRKPHDGPYQVTVNNYNQRETSDPGFIIEVENAGRVLHYTYNKIVRNRSDVHVARLFMKDGIIDNVEVADPAITAGTFSQEKWGLKTEQYHKVSAVMWSPNYWGDNAVGNRHTFFVLDGCKNDEPTRGFYNEFLHPRLEPHRKVFEIIGDKTKCQPTEGQLSGLGFSSTKHESFIVRVYQGKKQRVFNVHV